jgi:hypothetical protein
MLDKSNTSARQIYAKQIGLLHEKILRSPFSPAEARIVYELAHHEKSTATALSNDLFSDQKNLQLFLLIRVHSLSAALIVDSETIDLILAGK